MITVGTKFGQLKHRLRRMDARGENIKPVLEHIGDEILKSIDLNFSEGGRHSGDPDSIFGGSQSWESWSPKYQKKRGSGQILLDTGNLVGGLDKEVSKDELLITSGGGGSSVYAARQHYGGGGIPARPFMVIQEEDLDDALQDLSRFLINGKF